MPRTPALLFLLVFAATTATGDVAVSTSFLESSSSKRAKRDTKGKEEEPTAVNLIVRCAREMNCLVSPECNDKSVDTRCAQYNGSECPRPQCRREVQTVFEIHGINSNHTACSRQNNCTLSSWCEDPGYAVWCRDKDNGCPAPMCEVHINSSTPRSSFNPGRHARASPPSFLPPLPSPMPLSEPMLVSLGGNTTTSRPPPLDLLPFPLPLGAPLRLMSAQNPLERVETQISAGPSVGITSWFSIRDFAEFFPHIGEFACTGHDFFTYHAFITAASAFPAFANSGNTTQDRNELAAFFAHSSHATGGGWATAPGGPQSWGYCFKEARGCEAGDCRFEYCEVGNPCADFGFDCTCADHASYHGRGPLMLTGNLKYALASKALFGDPNRLLDNPSLVSHNATLAYMTSIWTWMTSQQFQHPSCHDVITGQWVPTQEDTAGGRKVGFGMTINLINGPAECNVVTHSDVQDRVEFYLRFAGLLGVEVIQSALYCNVMQPYTVLSSSAPVYDDDA